MLRKNGSYYQEERYRCHSGNIPAFQANVALTGVYTDPDITYPNGDQAQSIVIAFKLQVIGGKLFCGQEETPELKYFTKEERPQLFTGSHEALWNDIFK